MRLRSSFPLFAGPVARGATVSFGIRLCGIGIATLQAILTARLLGADGYGAVAFALSLSSIFAVIALIGTEPLAAREVARFQTLKDTAGLKGFLRAIRRAVLATALVGALLWWWIGPAFWPSDAETPWQGTAVFVAIVFPLAAWTLQTQGILRGFGLVAGAQVPLLVVRPLVVLAFLTTAWMLAWDIRPVDYMLAVVVGGTLALLLATVILRQTKARLEDGPATSPATVPLVRAAAPFLAVSVIGILGGEINTVLLTVWTTTEQTGLFQPIARITPLLVLATQAVGVRYGPRIAELRTAGETERLALVTRQVTLATTGFTVLAAAVLLTFAKPILGLFGPEFAAVSRALWWVAAAQIVNGACGPVGLLLSMSGRASRTVGPQLFGLVVNLGVAAWLIPSMGAEGAAIALAAGIVCWNVAMLISVRRHLGEDPSLWGLWRARAK